MKLTLILLTCYVFAALVLLTRVIPTRLIRFQLLKPLREKLRFLNRPRVSLMVVFSVSLLLSAAISLVKEPLPRYHDEFSYLLAADTFSHGRLANPTHPFWKHFESFHIIHQPTYASKYPPGQGLFLAFGQVVTGHPIVGVWLSVALAATAICWMLQAWMPPRWAFLGGLLAALHPTMILWGQNFWGGGVAVLGGALLIGSLRRLFDRPRFLTTLLLGVGLLLLSISRPFEGFLTAACSISLWLIWIYRERSIPLATFIRSILVPLVMSAVAITGVIAVYNLSVTGSVARFPYQVHEATYSPTPLFFWGTPSEITIDNPHLKSFHTGWSLDVWKKQQSLSGYGEMLLLKFSRLAGNLVVFPLGILVLMVPWVIRERWGRFAVIVTALICAVNLFCTTFFQPHYLSPVFPLFCLIFIEGARHWRVAKWRDSNRGPVFVAGLGLIFLVMSLTRVWLYAADANLPAQYPLALKRAALLEQLQQEPGKDLVFLQYGPDHDPHFEWIYNAADIDNADVVWAHILNPESNQELIEHFPERRVWWINADADPVELNSIETTPLPERSK